MSLMDDSREDFSDRMIGELVKTGSIDLTKYLLRSALSPDVPSAPVEYHSAVKRRSNLNDDRNQYALYLIKDFLLNLGCRRTWDTLLVELDIDDLDDGTGGAYSQPSILNKLNTICKPLIDPEALNQFDDEGNAKEITDKDHRPYELEHRNEDNSLLVSFISQAWKTKQQQIEQELENTQRQYAVAQRLDPVSTQEYRKFVEQLKTQNANVPTPQTGGQQEGAEEISIPITTTNNSATIMSLSNHDPVRNAKNNSLPPPVAVTPTKSMQPTQLTIGTDNNNPPTATPALNTNLATTTTTTTFNKPLTPKRATTANVFGPGITTTAGPTAPYSSRGKSPVRAVPQSPRSAAMNNNNNNNNLTTNNPTNLIFPSQDLPSHASNTSNVTTDSTGPSGTPTNAHRTPQKVGSKRWVFAPAPAAQSATLPTDQQQVLETPVTQQTQQKIPKT